jgi:Xaa-Pro aminopeptidase
VSAGSPAGLAPLLVGERLDSLRGLLDAAGVDSLLVTSSTNIRYLTGFTGSAGSLWVDVDRAVLVTDGRYRDQAPDQTGAAGAVVDVVVVGGGDRSPIATLAGGCSSVGLEAGSITWAEQRRLAELLPSTPLATDGLVEGLRELKDEGEVDRIAAAAAIADRALAEVLPSIQDGAVEEEIAMALDHAVRSGGASDRAFETIVAAGPNSARPHARPGTRPMLDGDLVVCDFGAMVDGYRSDMTRSLRIGGTRTGRAADLLGAVLDAQLAGLAVVADGVPIAEVDTACRSSLEAAGLGDAFSHGTGHGVGLDIHEGPAVSSTSTGTLLAGQVVTVEPGAYLGGFGGVRWEDTVLVTADGHRRLTLSPKEL